MNEKRVTLPGMWDPRPGNARPIGERINFDAADGCWEWTGAGDKGNYGQLMIGGVVTKPHRVVYTIIKGEIPDGLELDHLCRNTRCVNPDHLEPVTHKENVARGQSISAMYAARTHCPQGHELSGDNLGRAEMRRGYRSCVICRRARERARGKRNRTVTP